MSQNSSIALALGLIAFASTAQAQEAAADSTTDRAFLEGLRTRDSAGFPEDLLELDYSFRDSVVALQDSLGLKTFRKLGSSRPRPLRWGFGLGRRLMAYNRVDGFVGAANLRLMPRGREGPRLSTEAGWAFASQEIRHWTQLQIPWSTGGGRWQFTMGGGDRTRPFGTNQIFANSLRAALGGADEQDYLRWRGIDTELSLNPGPWRLSVAYSAARLQSMEIATERSAVASIDRPNPPSTRESSEASGCESYSTKGPRLDFGPASNIGLPAVDSEETSPSNAVTCGFEHANTWPGRNSYSTPTTSEAAGESPCRAWRTSAA